MFNKKDLKLLYELDSDCRQSDAELGRKLKISKQAVRYRIEKLIKGDWITTFVSVIDTYKLGYYKFKLYLSFTDANKEKIREILNYLLKDPRTEWIASCSGKWDIIAGHIVKTPYVFHQAIRDLEEKYSQYISSKEITISLGVPHWKKEYLLDKKPPYSYYIQGGSLGNYELDDTDERIIKLIVNNARMSLIEIARRLKLSVRIVKYRLQKLKKDKIILQQRILFNFPRLNYIFCKALIKFKNLNKEKYDKFMAACSDQPNLVYTIDCIGSWDIELDFEMHDFNSFHRVMLELRDKFSDIIAHYDFVIVLSEDKLDYYPGADPQYE